MQEEESGRDTQPPQQYRTGCDQIHKGRGGEQQISSAGPRTQCQSEEEESGIQRTLQKD